MAQARGNLRVIGVISAAAVVTAALATVQLPAAVASPAAPSAARDALTSSPVPAPDVSSRLAPSWQTDNTVWALAYSKGVVYVGGQFANVRPPGAAPGTDQQPRTYLAAFNSTTGALITTFDPTITETGAASSPGVYSLAVSPDGTTLYVGGTFDHVNGSYRDNLAAFNIATGALTSWQPSAYGKVNAIAPSPNGEEIYIGGGFDELGTAGSTAGIQDRTYAGAVDASGNLLPWAPVVDNAVTSIAVDPDDSQVLIGGYFDTLNGAAQPAAGAVDPASGTTNLAWTNANIVPDDSSCYPPAVKAIVISNGVAYLSSEGTGGGCFDGDFAVSLAPTGDSLVWQNDCLGATQALVVIHGYLFKGSHAHDCAYAPGGFPQVNDASGWVTHHLLDQSLTDGSLGHWTPNTNGNDLGPRAMATDGSQLFLGGDFTSVNNSPQQGFARFAAGADPTPPAKPGRPTVTSVWKGKAEVTFGAVSTSDIGKLTYTIYRTGRATPVGTMTANSWPWALPVLHYTATGLKPGSKPRFWVTASDGVSTSARSAESVPVKVAASNPPESYQKTILASKPSFLWPLGEKKGKVAADATSHDFTGDYEPGTTHDSGGGPITGSTAEATGFNGLTGIVTARHRELSPSSFSVELWFKTSTNKGGELVGFGTAKTGLSTDYDRMIYMMNDGQLVFGVISSGIQTIETPSAYNDGRWHFAVATFSLTSGTGTMTLYVDGARIGTQQVGALTSYEGYWRVGGGNLAGWNLDYWGSNSQGTTEPNSYYFDGAAMDVAVFPGALSAGWVALEYTRAAP